MAEVTARLAREVGFDTFADLKDRDGHPLRPTRITPNPDGTLTIEFPDAAEGEPPFVDEAALAAVKLRMETRDDAEAGLVSELHADYDANEAAMPFQNAQIQALTQQMQRVIRLVTGRPEAD